MNIFMVKLLFYFKFQADSLAEAECWRDHLATAFDSVTEGTDNAAFSQMMEGTSGGESSENSGSANVADIVHSPPQQKPDVNANNGKKVLSMFNASVIR